MKSACIVKSQLCLAMNTRYSTKTKVSLDYQNISVEF